MDVRAAVAFEAGQPLSIGTVQFEATGICHTDEFTRLGDGPEGMFPAIRGHEGAGIVVDAGPGMRSRKSSACPISSSRRRSRASLRRQACPSCGLSISQRHRASI